MPIIQISQEEWDNLQSELIRIKGVISLLQKRYNGVSAILKVPDAEIVNIGDACKKLNNHETRLGTLELKINELKVTPETSGDTK